MFSYKFCEVFKNTFFAKHFWWLQVVQNVYNAEPLLNVKIITQINNREMRRFCHLPSLFLWRDAKFLSPTFIISVLPHALVLRIMTIIGFFWFSKFTCHVQLETPNMFPSISYIIPFFVFLFSSNEFNFLWSFLKTTI